MGRILLTENDFELSIPFWSDFIHNIRRPHPCESQSFQSHFGLILSSWYTFTNASFSFLSIPFWSDFIWVEYYSQKTTSSFQSHFGLILSALFSFHPKRNLRTFNPILVWFYRLPCCRADEGFISLSIPFWSDFIRSWSHHPWWDNNSFQSHFGLILSRKTTFKRFKPSAPFNPILVWFYR